MINLIGISSIVTLSQPAIQPFLLNYFRSFICQLNLITTSKAALNCTVNPWLKNPCCAKWSVNDSMSSRKKNSKFVLITLRFCHKPAFASSQNSNWRSQKQAKREGETLHIQYQTIPYCDIEWICVISMILSAQSSPNVFRPEASSAATIHTLMCFRNSLSLFYSCSIK